LALAAEQDGLEHVTMPQGYDAGAYDANAQPEAAHVDKA
jgi:hypothetical protein